jgi:NitT/TauT family transport system substrate-binding protein
MCGATRGGPSTEGLDLAGAAVVQGVVLRDGDPVPDGYVRLLDAGGEFTAEVPTSATGQFRFFAAPGRWTVRTLVPKAEVVDRQVVATLGEVADLESIKDLAGKRIGVSAPGSSTDFFLKFMLKKNGVDPASVGVIGIGLGATAIAAMEQGSVDAAIMLDPAVTLLQGKNKDLRILSDTRTQKDTIDVFGGEYPGGALYTRADWIAKNPKTAAAMAKAIVNTLKWIHSHTPEEIMAKMPPELVGADKALYLAALKNTIPMYSTTGRMDPKGAQAVLAVFSQSSPEVAKANIDLSKTYTNQFVDQALGTSGAR